MFDENKRPVRNQAVIIAEREGYARELLGTGIQALSDEVQRDIRRMSFAEIIS